MTSRSVGQYEPFQRPASGGPQRVSSRARLPAHPTLTSSLRQDDLVIDLTSDGDNRMVEDSLHKARPVKSAAVGPDGEPLQVDTNAVAERLPTRNYPWGIPQLHLGDGSQVDGVLFEQTPGSATSSKNFNSLVSPTVLPFPPRPGAHPIEDRTRDGNADAGGVKTRKGGFDPPAASLCFPKSKPIDFNPWYGTHQEDRLTEVNVKTGFFSKPQAHKESQTARPTLWSSLKNRGGLGNLSQLFIKVMEHRQACNRLTAPSSFKPPPRVTLTDSKREGWLKELANPAVALRRLSRTIPHGIRGKQLLEQCLAKNIPTPRAVWLAKCVGANEMRAFKRKGATVTTGAVGEVKWIKEWSIFVQQFVESVVNAVGQSDWKPRMDYAIRLSTSLYNERLVDQDHYLDWVLTALEGCQSDKLPIWLLLVHIYWRDLVASRRRGSRLAEGLLLHCKQMTAEPGDNVDNSVNRRIDQLILSLLVSHRDCLLLPKTWASHENALQALIDRVPDKAKFKVRAVVQQLHNRNNRLRNGVGSHQTSAQTPEKAIIRILDSIGHKVDMAQISAQCLSLSQDHELLVNLVLKWSCSIFRTGTHRIYLAVRILLKWHTVGVDTESALLKFLRSLDSNRSYSPACAFRIIAELVRSKRFSVGKYLQWLIATGSLSANLNNVQNVPYHTRFIIECPLAGLSEHAQNLRESLLDGMGYSADHEDNHIEQLQTAIGDWIRNMAGSELTPPIDSHPDIANECLSVRFALSYDLREEIFDRTTSTGTRKSKAGQVGSSANGNGFSLLEFCCVREILEQLEDYPILADVIGIVTKCGDYATLSAVADTLNYHSLTFAAIGALVPLIGNLAKKYSVLRTERTPDQLFLRAFIDLCCSVQTDPQLVNLLKNDLGRIERQNSIAVCSPASDNMTEILQSTHMDTDDEIERILTSGNSMDEQIMDRVFKKITSRLADSKRGHDIDSFSSWFPRLRSFDEKTFERHALEWLFTLLVEQRFALLQVALPVLVASSCINLTDVAKHLSKKLEKFGPHFGAAAARMSIEVLGSILPSKNIITSCRPQDAYRYRLEQRRLCSGSVALVLQSLMHSIDQYCNYSSNVDHLELDSLMCSSRLLDVLKPVATSNKQILLGAFPENLNEDKALRVKKVFDILLDPSNQFRLSDIPLGDQVGVVIDAIDDLSLPFCQLELRQIFRMDKITSEEGENSVELALLDAMKAAVARNSSGVSELVSGLGEGVNRKIREHNEEQVLNAVRLKGKKCMQSLQQVECPTEATLRRYLMVVDSISLTSDGAGYSTPTLVALIDRLKLLNDCLNTGDESRPPGIYELNDPKLITAVNNVCPWLEALLHLAIAHRPSLQGPKESTSGLATVLCLLRSLLVSPWLQRNPSVAQYVFDVAAVFSDDLPDELRVHFAKAEASKPSTGPYTFFLFGGCASADGWLGVIPGQSNDNPAPATPTVSQHSRQHPPSRTRSPVTPVPAMRGQNTPQRMSPQQSHGQRTPVPAMREQNTPQRTSPQQSHGQRTPVPAMRGQNTPQRMSPQQYHGQRNQQFTPLSRQTSQQQRLAQQTHAMFQGYGQGTTSATNWSMSQQYAQQQQFQSSQNAQGMRYQHHQTLPPTPPTPQLPTPTSTFANRLTSTSAMIQQSVCNCSVQGELAEYSADYRSVELSSDASR